MMTEDGGVDVEKWNTVATRFLPTYVCLHRKSLTSLGIIEG